MKPILIKQKNLLGLVVVMSILLLNDQDESLQVRVQLFLVEEQGFEVLDFFVQIKSRRTCQNFWSI